MMHGSASLLPLADGLESLIWIIVVIGSIAAQIAKASRRSGRKADSMPEPSPGRGGPPVLSPEEELRKFIESLGGGGTRPRPVPATPPPLRAPAPRAAAPTLASARPATTAPVRRPRQAPRPRPDHAERRRAVRNANRAQRARRPAVMPPPVGARPPQPARAPVPSVVVAPQGAAAASAAAAPQTEPRRRVQIAGRLMNADVLRAAVVWREILSPPIALRQR